MTSPNVIPVPVDYQSFIALAPAFNSPRFSQDQVEFWLLVATTMVNQQRWGSTSGLAVLLFTEHNLSLEALAAQGGASGIPGLSTGVASSKSVKSVSVSYDTSIGTVADAGHWNLTVYGTRLLWLVGALTGCVSSLGATARRFCAAASRRLSRGQS